MMAAPEHPKTREVDERFIGQWVAQGFRSMSAYLYKHAAFDAWCVEHPPKEDE